jgi:hypothetical protein
VTSELQGDARNISGGLTTEMVDQFEVETSGVPAYYEGQGAINFILKSGTNRFHGHGYGNIRNTVFDAAGYFNAKAPIEHQAEFGASVGGPILRNRLFFYVNEDFFRLRSGTTPSPYSLPTPAELGGDFSAVPTPIYGNAGHDQQKRELPGRQEHRDKAGSLRVFHVSSQDHNYLSEIMSRWLSIGI